MILVMSRWINGNNRMKVCDNLLKVLPSVCWQTIHFKIIKKYIISVDDKYFTGNLKLITA